MYSVFKLLQHDQLEAKNESYYTYKLNSSLHFTEAQINEFLSSDESTEEKNCHIYGNIVIPLQTWGRTE